MPIRHQAFTDPEATTVPTEHRSGVPAQTVRDTDRSPAAIVGALCVAGVAVALMQTIIVPLVPRLPEYLRTSNDNAAWALTATLLAAAVAMPIAGRLGDMYGKRLLLLLSLATVVAGSAVCAMSDTLAPFLVGRGLQGLGMGAVALGIGILRDCLPPERLGGAVALMSAALGVGGALGLPVAAGIAQRDWHALFWTAAGFGLVCLIAVVAVVPESPTYREARFDYFGALGLVAALTLLLVPLSKGSAWGWASPRVVGMFVCGAVIFAAWTVYEWRRAHPLVDLRINATRAVALTNAASAATGFAFFAITVVPILLLMAPSESGNGNDLPMSTAGALLMPGGLTMVVFAAVGAILAKKFGGRIALAAGGAMMALGYVIAVLPLAAGWHVAPWYVVMISCTVSTGIGAAYAVMPALIMSAVPQRQTGEANGVNSLVRSLGTSVAAAVVGMLLARFVVILDDGDAYPSTTGYLAAIGVSLAACLVTIACAVAIPASTETPS